MQNQILQYGRHASYKASRSEHIASHFEHECPVLSTTTDLKKWLQTDVKIQLISLFIDFTTFTDVQTFDLYP